ncbi:MAG: hypothetical protein ABI593_02715 [Betaproteobacteria bacterium]
MTAFEYPLLAALMAPSPGAAGRVQVTAVDPASPIDVAHAVAFVDEAMVLPPSLSFVRRRVVLLLSYPATAAH